MKLVEKEMQKPYFDLETIQTGKFLASCSNGTLIIPRYQPMRASAVGAAKTLFSAC